MTEGAFLEKLKEIQEMKIETSTLEIKAANDGCPKRLYDTLSSFSNQSEGGLIVFGVDERQGFKEVGVYDAGDLQNKIKEQCLQMEPTVRPLITIVEKNEKFFVAAEIPGVDISERPVHYKGKGILKGSYTRVGESDEPMTEYEIYSYEAYKRKYQDDIRPISRTSLASLDEARYKEYIHLLKEGKPRLANLPDDVICNLMSIIVDEKATLSSVLNFAPYPQAYFPQLCIIAMAIPGTEMGQLGDANERFIDNCRIEGTISQMLEEAIKFVARNMRTKTIINPQTGKREDEPEYPITAVREVILNALVHRDYSIHTEGMPIQIRMYTDRLEVRNPGGLYGRIQINQLGSVQPDTRNPTLATALEVLRITENRYSGIPTIKKAMREHNLPEPEFLDERGSFVVRLFNNTISVANDLREEEIRIAEFCRTPRTRKEICDFLGITSTTYGIKTKVMPLVEKGIIKLELPDKPGSSKQRFYS